MAGQTAHQIATGTLKPTPGTKFKAGTLGEREIKDKSVIITGPPLTFTAENIDKFKF